MLPRPWGSGSGPRGQERRVHHTAQDRRSTRVGGQRRQFLEETTAMSSAQITAGRPRALSDAEVDQLDPYAFFAVLGKRVIHPGGRAATDELIRRADFRADQRVLDVGCGVGTTAFWRTPPTAEARHIFLDVVCPGMQFE